MMNPRASRPDPHAGPQWDLARLAGTRDFAAAIDTAAVMIVHRGRPIYQWGDVAARYRCHSVRKSLLSALIGIHVGEGRIDLECTLGELGIDDRDGLSVRSYSHAGDRGGYGYMWWVAERDVHFPQMSVPHGTYSARGAHGHYVVVVPQRELVIVHRVDSDRPGREVSAMAFGALLDRILAAQRLASGDMLVGRRDMD